LGYLVQQSAQVQWDSHVHVLLVFCDFPSSLLLKYENHNTIEISLIDTTTNEKTTHKDVKMNPRTLNQDFHWNIVLCTMVKDEGLFLREWIEYHFLQGINHVVLYDNNSNDNTKLNISNWLKYWNENKIEPKITHIYWGHFASQIHAMNHCLYRFGPHTRWILYEDVDEFMVPTIALSSGTQQTVADILVDTTSKSIYQFVDRTYDNNTTTAIVAKSIMYGTSGHLSRPQD